jgi:superfamily II DNA or RNA helicase
MKIVIPPVLAINEASDRKDVIQQIKNPALILDGTTSRFTRGSLSGTLFQEEGSQNRILIVPPEARVGTIGSDIDSIISSAAEPKEELLDVSDGRWLRKSNLVIHGVSDNVADRTKAVLESWTGAFSYVEENVAENLPGLRKPQIGALHAVHAHWSVSNSPATVVMPTGTGKTETMLCILVSARCQKVLVVVPTDALRQQIFMKFLDLGILGKLGNPVLSTSAYFPVVCRLEHVPKSQRELDSIAERTMVIVTSSAVVGQCSPEIQRRFADHCTHLFIDEAHHVEAPTWQIFRGHFKDRRVVQFTATPFREDGKPLDGEIVYSYPLRNAQQEGYFKAIRFERVLEFDSKRADAAIAQKAVEHLRKEENKNHILMARVDSIKRAKEVFEHYKKYTEFAPIELHSGVTSLRARETARKQLLSKASRIVVCVDMLGEGFDLPELKIAAFHDIRKSLAVTLQLAGRFTRSRSDLGDATFIANVADVSVQEELQKLYSQDPDWNLLLPDLSEQMIGKQKALQDFLQSFSEFPSEVPLKAIRPAMSSVVYSTHCERWTPGNFREGIPSADACEQIHNSLNQRDRTLVVVAARKSALQWTDAENLYDWQWELYIAFWDEAHSLLFINGSSNKGEFRSLASALTDDHAALISGQQVFRVFSGLNRIRLQNVGLSEQIGRNVRYTGRMGSDVEAQINQIVRGNAQKSVIAGVGFESGALTSIGASRKGRIWSHECDKLNDFVAWCRLIGGKLLDEAIDPDSVLSGTLIPERLSYRPKLMPIGVDWPESVYTEPEKNWIISIGGRDYLIAELGIKLINPATSGPLIVEIVGDDRRISLELKFVGGTENPDFQFQSISTTPATIRHGLRGEPKNLSDYLTEDAPVIWFADGSSLEGNQWVPLREPKPPFDKSKIIGWDWNGTNIQTESQGEDRTATSVQARVIRYLQTQATYDVLFDDDSPGEAADIVAVKGVGGLKQPAEIKVDFFHCKFSRGANSGGRVEDLYELCGQAQTSIWWAGSPAKKSDLFTHLMRREQLRRDNGRATRFEIGSVEVLHTIREISRSLPVSIAITIVQPGLSKDRVSEDQLRLLGVTEHHLMETLALPFNVIGNAR